MSTSVTQNETTVTPAQPRALQPLEANPRLFAQQGPVVAIWRKYRKKKVGPYWRLVYRKQRKRRGTLMNANLGPSTPDAPSVRRVPRPPPPRPPTKLPPAPPRSTGHDCYNGLPIGGYVAPDRTRTARRWNRPARNSVENPKKGS